MDQLRRLLPYVGPHIPLLIVALALLVASGLLEVLIVMLLGPMINWLPAGTPGIPNADSMDALSRGTDDFQVLDRLLALTEGGLDWVAFLLVLFSLLKGVFLYFADYSMFYAGQQVVAGLRKQLNAHLMDQSLAFYVLHPAGKLISRVISDTERLQETVSRTLTDFLRQVFLLIFFLGLVIYINWRLAILSLIIAPIVLFVTLKLGKKIRAFSSHSQENLSDLHQALQESIAGQRVVKAFGMEDYERQRFNQQTDKLVRINLRAARVAALSSPLMEFIGYVSFVPFLLYANLQIENGVSIGSFFVFVISLLRLYEPVRRLSRIHLHFQQALASSNRIFEVLSTKIEIPSLPGAPALPHFSDRIAFQDVFFRYQSRKESTILDSVNLTIRRGEVVALVGSSGAGKTTLVSLIPRFFDVSAGAIEIDGQDIRQVDLASLRRQIAIVTQETFLFNDTVRNNIAYGRQDCSVEEIEEAAKAAFIDEFVAGLPDGYDTQIGDQRLSGGQRQRFAIARAILKKAPILILDEATSALDSESEALVQDALSNLMRERTTLVIAHRLSTIRAADRIAVMESGRVVETGDHKSLIGRSGLYRRLHDIQFRGHNEPEEVTAS